MQLFSVILGIWRQNSAMALVVCYIHHFAFSRIIIFLNRKRSDIRLQHIHLFNLDSFRRVERMELAYSVLVVHWTQWFVEIGRFGTFACKLLENIVNSLSLTWVSLESRLDVRSCFRSLFFYKENDNIIKFSFQMGTMASVHASTNPSMMGSRPTTPYTASTIH